MSKRDVVKRFRGFIQRAIVQQAIQSIAWVICVFAIGLGATLIFAPEQIIVRPTFNANMNFAPPHIWGIGFGVLGLLLALTLSRNVRMAPLPLYGLTILVSVWGFFTVPPVIAMDGSATALWAYTALGMICAIAGASVDYDPTDRNGNRL